MVAFVGSGVMARLHLLDLHRQLRRQADCRSRRRSTRPAFASWLEPVNASLAFAHRPSFSSGSAFSTCCTGTRSSSRFSAVSMLPVLQHEDPHVRPATSAIGRASSISALSARAAHAWLRRRFVAPAEAHRRRTAPLSAAATPDAATKIQPKRKRPLKDGSGSRAGARRSGVDALASAVGLLGEPHSQRRMGRDHRFVDAGRHALRAERRRA